MEAAAGVIKVEIRSRSACLISRENVFEPSDFEANNTMLILAFTLLCLLVSVIYHQQKRIGQFTPMNVMCFWNVLFWGVAKWKSLYYVPEDLQFSLIIIGALLFLLLGMLCYGRVAVSPLQPMRLDQVNPMNVKISNALIWHFGGLCVFFMIRNIVSKGTISIEELYDFSSYAEDLKYGGTSMGLFDRVLKLYSKVSFYLFLIGVGYQFYQSRARLWKGLYAVVLIYSVSKLTSYGGRQVVLVLFVLVFVVYAAFHPRRLMLKVGIVFFVAAFATMGLQLVRQGKISAIEERGSKVLLETAGSGGEWTSVANAADVMSVYELFPDPADAVQRAFEEVFYWAINWIPRPLWPGKPATSFSPRMTVELYEKQFFGNETWVRTFTFVGQGFYVAGVLGVLAFSFLYGATTSWLLKHCRVSPALYGVYAFLLFKMLVTARNDLTSWAFQGISAFVICLLLWRIVYRRDAKSEGWFLLR